MSEQPQSLKRLRERLGGIETEVMNGDNLAIVLCSFFDDGEESEDDTNWSPAAIAGCNQVLEAIHQYYAAALSAHLAPAQQAPSEKMKMVDELSYWLRVIGDRIGANDRRFSDMARDLAAALRAPEAAEAAAPGRDAVKAAITAGRKSFGMRLQDTRSIEEMQDDRSTDNVLALYASPATGARERAAETDEQLAREINRAAGCHPDSERTRKIIKWYRGKTALAPDTTAQLPQERGQLSTCHRPEGDQ